MAADMAVRRLGPGDTAQLTTLFEGADDEATRRGFDPFPLNAQSAAALTTAGGQDRFFGLWEHDRLRAFAMLRGWDEGYDVPSFGIVVAPDARGRGHGRRLTRAVVQDARDAGCERVRLSVYPDNTVAHGLYVDLGFEETERTDERIVMHLELGRDRIPVAEPALVGNELAYVKDCLETSWISSVGPYVDRFEQDFAAFTGTAHAIACCNGTAALHVALLAAGVGPGDEVVVPALTYVACANAVAQTGATVVLADVDPVTWTLDPTAVERVLTARTRALLVVHLYGHPADMDALQEIADRHDLAVVEDAAEAHGARYRGRPAGSLGDVAIFSFYGNKIITTGEGGMVVTDDADFAARVRLLRGQGMDPERRYWHPVQGFNYRMTNVAAAIGVAQLERADWLIERRREVAGWYAAALADAPRVTTAATADWATHAHWMTTAVVEGDRDAVMARLDAAGIETRPFFHPLHVLPPYTALGGSGAFGVSERLAAQGLCLPSSATLTRGQVERVAAALRSAS